MSKTRDTGYLANVIQVHDTGVRIMSGSTMLMAVSSSGAVTITGEISGSDAANALLLSGTGSVGFTTTASFLAVSSSQQQVSASYIALSGSYTTFSGSASTRITENSSSIQQVSSSQQQISASLLQVSASYTALSGSYNTYSSSVSTRVSQIETVYATTGSNSFRANQSITGSLVVSSTITAQTLVVQTVTSSILYSSGSNIFGNQLVNTQTFTGSVNITGSLALAGNITSNGTAVVLGSGTTNYLPKFTGASTIGNSTIVNDGTTTFINTTSGSVPPSLFVLQNAGANPHIRGISLYNQSSVGDGTEYISISHLEALKGQIQVGNATVTGSLLLNPLGGNVGIGTTSPCQLLDVNGSLNLGPSGGIFFNTGLALFPYGGHTYIRPYSANGNINFQNQAGNLLFTMLDGGNVGIGTATPAYTLDVNGLVNINAQATGCQGTVQSLRISSNIADAAVTINACSLLNYTYLAFAQNCVGKFEIGFSSCTDTTSPSTFYLNPNVQKGACGSAVFIKSNGNVGIGNANTDSYNNYIVLQVSGSTGGIIQTSDGTVKTAIVSNSQGAGLMGTRTNHDLRIVANDTERIRIMSTGIACFACQVCVGGMLITNNSSFGTPLTEAAFRIRMYDNGGINNDPGIGLDGSGGGGEKMWFNALGGFYFNFGTNGNKININSDGLACFVSQICATSGVKFGNGATTLNYYEEGTWTPRLISGTWTSTATGGNAGWYTRIGNLATVGGTIQWTGGSGTQGTLLITCLPFTSNSTGNSRNVGQIGAPGGDSIAYVCSTKGQFVIVNDPNQATMYIIETFQSGTWATYTHGPTVNNSGVIYGFQITYHI